MVGFFTTAKNWLGTHHVEVYNPVLRSVNAFVRSLFIAGGGIVEGFGLARLFPDFLTTASTEEVTAKMSQCDRSHHANSFNDRTRESPVDPL